MNKFNFNLKNKILLSSLGAEIFFFLFVLLSANTIVPLSSGRLIWLGIFTLAMMVTGLLLYFQNKEFYIHHQKKFHVLFTILLILIPMLFAGYIRSYTYNLPIADRWAQDTIDNNIKSQIAVNVQKEFPNLPSAQINEEVNRRYQIFAEENYDQMLVEQKKLSTDLRNQFQAENGQTYFLEIDPYYYHTLSRNLYETGQRGDFITEDGRELLTKRLAPTGVDHSSSDFHSWLEAKIFGWNGFDENTTNGERMRSVYFLPVLFSMLTVIPLFFILRLYGNNLFAFLASLSLVSISTFVYRTIAGFVDTDAYNVLFPLIILCLIVYALNAKNNYLSASLAILAGLMQIVYLWAWGNGWFAFLFVTLALSIYFAYTLVIEFFRKTNIREIVSNLKKELIVLIAFFGSSVIFSMIRGQNILSETIKAISSSAGGIANADIGNIWPNVYSSVGELNPASFGTIIESVGGKLVFFIALIGVLFLAIDFKHKRENYNIYKNILFVSAIVWFSFFILEFKNMGILLNFHNFLISLTNNHPVIFVGLLFLPMIIAVLFAMHNTISDKKTFLTFLLMIWMGGTIYMSFHGVRFVLLLASAFSIAFGLGLYYLAMFGNKHIPKLLDLEKVEFMKIIGSIIILCLFMLTFVPVVKSAHEVAIGTVPGFDDNWFGLMDKIKTNSNETAIITSWWDFGHFYINIGERGATFDGASQTTPQSHWVGKLLMENDEEVAHDILQMLVCGGNEAFEVMLEKTNDATGGVLVNKVIYSTFGKDNKRELLKNNKYFEFSETDVDEIMEKLACENPNEQFVIASEDMVSKSAVWAHWGSWDFTRKYVLDNYNTLSAEEISKNIDEPLEKIQSMVGELQDLDLKSKLKNIKRSDLVNSWLAPYPGYISANSGEGWVSCIKKENSLNCQNSVLVDLDKMSVKFTQTDQIGVKNLVVSQSTGLKTKIQSENGNIDVVVRETSGNYDLMITSSPLGNSMFTKLFYLNGVGLTHFERFDSRVSTTGWNIETWKVKWD